MFKSFTPSKYEGLQEAGSRFQSNSSSAGKSFGNKFKKFDKKAPFKKTFGKLKKKFSGKGGYKSGSQGQASNYAGQGSGSYKPSGSFANR